MSYTEYTVLLEVRLEAFVGEPEWDVVAKALQRRIKRGPTFSIDGMAVRVTTVAIDTSDEEALA